MKPLRLLRSGALVAALAAPAACHLDALFHAPGSSGPQAVSPDVAALLLVFTVQPRNALPGATIQPPVQLTAVDTLGYAATNFTGVVRLMIGHDGSVLGNATLSGTTSVVARAGVATFGDLSIVQPGVNYTLKAGFGTRAPIAESAPFTIGP
ncbi:MAG TPA: hypothetical protein VH158_10265 [Gemmatimonadales bacterium]|jgi:hypothetical protein|nr:hypothetical protein [Gemmatimonadales bacterium]